jgi:ABC-type molybdenum transport system ATPase subunit/photorepair protein PhrA
MVARPMSTPLYELRQVEVSYEGRRILEVGQLAVQQGETLVVVGPNGAGKSTTPAAAQLWSRRAAAGCSSGASRCRIQRRWDCAAV